MTLHPPSLAPNANDPEGTLAEQVGRLLASLREATGVSRRALAQELRIADTTLLEVEHGRANPTLERLERLADGYGVELTITARPVGALREGRQHLFGRRSSRGKAARRGS